MLTGIAVSNSILIVEFTRHLRAQGMEVREAVALACRVRLRPVLMTSLATIIGLLPMALKLGEGSESYAPLARALLWRFGRFRRAHRVSGSRRIFARSRTEGRTGASLIRIDMNRTVVVAITTLGLSGLLPSQTIAPQLSLVDAQAMALRIIPRCWRRTQPICRRIRSPEQFDPPIIRL